MQHYNILIGCDQTYFDKWTVPLIQSIQQHNPKIYLHCHIVNPTKENYLDNVDITSEHVVFASETSKISYLQSVRFIIANNKFSNNELVFTLDADTICTRSFTEQELEQLFSQQHVLQHPKDNRWLAGMVVFKDNGFRQEYAKELFLKNTNDWEWGRDQIILAKLNKEYNFTPLPKSWMSIGKNKTESVFLTLKGDQKESSKYLKWYEKYLK